MKTITFALTIALAVCAQAQWTVVRLHPASTSESDSHGVSAGQQVGRAWTAEGSRASLWSSSAGSWINLHPVSEEWSEANGVSGGQQVGATGGGKSQIYRACRWTGTAASIIYLHPAGADRSWAWATDGTKQVGYAEINERRRASLWSNTAASWVNLDPPGSDESEACGIGDGQQVGYAYLNGGPTRAILWTGTAASWVNLHPVGQGASIALGASLGRQVGYVISGSFLQASLWSGTSGSWVSLHPLATEYSQGHAIHKDNQVGVAYINSVPRASFWSGTRASWIDLGQFLPSPFSGAAIAEGVHTDGAYTRVVGEAINPQIAGWEAVMWISRSIAPTSFTTVRGIVTGGNLASLTNSDEDRLVIRPGIVFATGEPPVQIRVDATAPTGSPNGIMFSVESSASFGNAQQKIWLWNYSIGDYELVDTRLATIGDDLTNVIVRTNSSRFIQAGTLAMRGLVTYRAVGPTFAYPWSARVDKLWWTFPG